MGFGGMTMTITNRGLQMDLAVKAGARAHFTRFGFGEGFLYGADPRTLTDMIAPVLYKPVARVVVSPDDKATAFGTLDSADVPRTFAWREYALYAADPESGEEILYAYVNGGDTAQVLDPSKTSQQVLRVAIAISRTDKITFQVTGANVTEVELEAALATKANLADMTELQAEVRDQLAAQDEAIQSQIDGQDEQIQQQIADQDARVNEALSIKQNTLVVADYTLSAIGWSERDNPSDDDVWEQTIIVPGLLTTHNFMITYAPGSKYAYQEANISALDTTEDELVTFVCADKPEVDVTVRIEPRTVGGAFDPDVAQHNTDALAHQLMSVDGNAGGAMISDSLEAHQINTGAHPNLRVDGNMMQGGQ